MPGYPMANNLRVKIPVSERLIVLDINPDEQICRGNARGRAIAVSKTMLAQSSLHRVREKWLRKWYVTKGLVYFTAFRFLGPDSFVERIERHHHLSSHRESRSRYICFNYREGNFACSGGKPNIYRLLDH